MTTSQTMPSRPILHDAFAGGLGANGLPLGWEAWFPTAAMRPDISVGDGPQPYGKRPIRMAGRGNPHAMGLVKRAIPGIEQGKSYRFRAGFRVTGIPNVQNTVWPFVSWGGRGKEQHLLPVAETDGLILAERILRIPDDAQDVYIELFAGWIPDGQVTWEEVTVEELPGYAPPHRPVTLAVIDEKPPADVPQMGNCRFYVEHIERACAAHRPDAICLPEHFNTTNVVGHDNPFGAIRMDSAYMRELQAAAARCRVNLIGSVIEDDDGVISNTGIALDRSGALVARYRKTHLPLVEAVRSGRSRGNALDVIGLDFGKVGILVCWDCQFPDPIRTLALKGAEVIFVPIAGEGRIPIHDAGGRRVANRGMEYAGGAAAVSNGVVMVFSATQSGPESWTESMIMDAWGRIRERSGVDATRRHVLATTIDLAEACPHWTGGSYWECYVLERRPELYGAMTDTRVHLWR